MLTIKLTKNQWARISEVFGNLGLVSVASIVLPSLMDKQNFLNTLLGLFSMIIFWYISLVTARGY